MAIGKQPSSGKVPLPLKDESFASRKHYTYGKFSSNPELNSVARVWSDFMGVGVVAGKEDQTLKGH